MITIDKDALAALLHNLAEQVAAGTATINNVQHNDYAILKRGTLNIGYNYR